MSDNTTTSSVPKPFYIPSDTEIWYEHAAKAGYRLIKIKRGHNNPPPYGWNKPKSKRHEKPERAAEIVKSGEWNIGTGCTPDCFIVDCDTPEAVKAFEEMLQNAGVTTLSALTPRGKHYLFSGGESRTMPQCAGNSALGPGVDTRGGGKGYGIGPGSTRTAASYPENKTKPDDSGGPWTYRVGDNVPAAPLTVELAQAIAPPAPVLEDAPEPEPGPAADPEPDEVTPFGDPVDVPEGERNNTVASWTATIANTDMVEPDILKCIHLLNRQSKRPLGRKEVEKTVRSILKRHREREPKHVRRARVYRPDKDSHADDIRRRLTALGYELRWNTRAVQMEIRKDDGPWENAEPMRLTLIAQMQTNCITPPYNRKEDAAKVLRGMAHKAVKKETANLYMDALAQRGSVDPFKLYLDGLPPFDPDKDERITDRFLEHVFALTDETKPLSGWALRSTMIGAVKRADEPGSKHDTVAVLVGEEGIGKSTLWAELVGRTEWFTDRLHFDAQNKEQVESLIGHVIIECAELAGLKRAEIPKLNAFITSREDKARLAYGHSRRDIPRTSVLVGTTNEGEVLPVTSGAPGRRWLPVGVKRGSIGTDGELETKAACRNRVMEKVRAFRDRLWAEAVYDVRVTGMHSGLPGELERAAEKAVDHHRKRDHHVEEKVAEFLQRYAVIGGQHPRWDGFKLADCIAEIDPSGRTFKSYQIQEALRGAGWAPGSKRTADGSLRRRWFPTDAAEDAAAAEAPVAPVAAVSS